MEETCRMSPGLTCERVKLPLTSVDVPFNVPLMMMVAPMTGSPEASVTVPRAVCGVCAEETVHASKKAIADRMAVRIGLDIVLKFKKFKENVFVVIDLCKSTKLF